METKKLSRFGIEAGAGVQAQLSNHWSLNVDYVGEFREHYKSNTGIVSVKYDF
ncbi:MAG: autotransporter outer membrane beta-barrel domain-containing protein [Alphaproteobacteria bacterium]|nr:autotransporter outer membrane beta-barrel domain-containing protein [Alphaproteobacteria bacterium]